MASFKNTPIRRKLTAIILLVSGAVLLLTCTAFFAYEFLTFRRSMLRELSTLGEIVADNSTAALAFQNSDDARETIGALKAQRHIRAAVLFDQDGNVFSKYPADLPAIAIPRPPMRDGYRLEESHLIGFQPVVEGNQKRLGTLYLQSDMGAITERFRVYAGIVALVIMGASVLAYALSRMLQRKISQPILVLAEAAEIISTRRDYSMRVIKQGEDEVGRLTDAFNQMLAQIHEQDIALRESEARTRAVLNCALSAVVVIDTSGKILDWNARAEKMFGWSRGEALGRDLSDTLVPARYREAHRHGLARFLATGKAVVLDTLLELSAVRRDGSEFPVELSISPITTGPIVSFCGFITDITDRKRAAEQITQLHQELEQRVVERTAQLQAANQELEAFSYSVSHDLRAPLRHVDGFASLLAKRANETLDPESRRYVATISKSAKRMGTLIDDLLAFSRIGRVPLRIERVDNNALVADVIANGRYESETTPITWEIGSLPAIQADQAMLRQVWVNLIDNAVKYSSKAAAPRIEIGGSEQPGSGEYVFFVRDNGVGFDMAYADKLFGVFQRLHGPSEFEGTGIGLANVRRIIIRHGGRTWAEARVNEGAAFYFSFPVHPSPPGPSG